MESKMMRADNVNDEYIYKNVQLCVANGNSGVPGVVGDVVSFPFLDLIIYLRVGLETDGKYGTFIITEDILRHFDLSVDNLFMNAFLNIEKAGYSIRKLSDVLKEMFCVTEEFDELPEHDDHLYVMTNSRNEFGAAGILVRTDLDAFADKLGAKKMVILPSSVHEILIIPIDFADGKDLRSIVNMINKSDIIDDSIFLSNNIYIYNRHGEMEIFSE